MANSTHVVGEGDRFGCATRLVRQFVADPEALGSLNASCAAKVPAIHTVGDYPEDLAEQPPLELSESPRPNGDRANREIRALAAAAVDTSGDAIARYLATTNSPDLGLHGGTVRVSDSGNRFLLFSDGLIPGVPVSGTIAITPDGLQASAALTATAPDGTEVQPTASWDVYGAGALAFVEAHEGPVSFLGQRSSPVGGTPE